MLRPIPISSVNTSFASGNGRADLVIRSPWGIGIIELGANGLLNCRALVPFDSMLGDWHLEPNDKIVGPGRLSSASPFGTLLFAKA